MKLYGIAIAAIPQKNNVHVIDLTCTPIVVSDDHPEKFEILDALAFKKTVDSRHVKEVVDCFVKTTETIGAVVKLQHESLAAHHLEYRPVALDIGIANARPINIEMLYANLFGARLTSPPAGERGVERAANIKAIFQQTPLGDASFPRKIENYAATGINPVNTTSAYLEDQAAQVRTYYENISRAIKQVPSNFSGIINYHRFRSACGDLSQLLGDCSLQFGRFGLKPVGDNQANVSPLQNEFDLKISQLKEPFEKGDPKARLELIALARDIGRKKANSMPDHYFKSKQFAIPNPFPNYGKDPKADEEMRNAYPRFFFYYLDADIERAFHQGFGEASRKRYPYTRDIKLPMDPPNPFFTDPCAWMVRDQLEIAKGARPAEYIEDQKEWRQRIAGYLADICNRNSSSPGKNIAPHQATWAHILAASRNGWALY